MNAAMPHLIEKPLFCGGKSLQSTPFVAAMHKGTIADAMRSQSAVQRFTLDGSESLERHLRRTCRRVRDEVQAVIPARMLEGIVLAGGYGRGEGGVLRSDRGDQPYNDLEFYILIGSRTGLAIRKFHGALQPLHESLSFMAGVEVEFKVLALDALRRSGVTMFYYDLVMGHRRLLGDGALFDNCEHHRDASRIPLGEATRLWMNRASGLLFSTERLRRRVFSADDADFVGRNLAKGRLALGDIVLTALGQYHWSCRERNRRLRALDTGDVSLNLPELVRHHDAGVEFKLHPLRSTETRESLDWQHRQLVSLAGAVLLWLENRRLGSAFGCLRDYAFSGVNKCPECRSWKNWLLTARHLGVRASLGRSAHRYPRERLFKSLALLLTPGTSSLAGRDLALLQHTLNTRATDFAGLVAAHETLWHRFG